MNTLNRYVISQRETFKNVIDEIKNDKKESHWMWFIFPQISGLGDSENSKLYSLHDKDECIKYMNHYLLRHRMIQCLNLIIEKETLSDLFNELDLIKFKSSMTLFMVSVPEHIIFKNVIEKFFNNKPCEKTLKFIS